MEKEAWHQASVLPELRYHEERRWLGNRSKKKQWVPSYEIGEYCAQKERRG